MMTLPAAAGLTSPAAGLRHNHSSLKLSASAVTGNVLPETFDMSPAIGALSSSISYSNAYPDETVAAVTSLDLIAAPTQPAAERLNAPLALQRTQNTTFGGVAALTVTVNKAVGSGKWIGAYVAGISRGDANISSVKSSPNGTVVRALWLNNGTSLFLLLGKPINAHQTLSLWIAYTAPQSVTLATARAGVGLASFVGLYSRSPNVDRDDRSSCQWDSRRLRISHVPDGSNSGFNESSFLMFIVRSPSVLKSGDILDLHVPAFVHTHCGAMFNVTSIGAGNFTKLESTSDRVIKLQVNDDVVAGFAAVFMVSSSTGWFKPVVDGWNRTVAFTATTGVITSVEVAVNISSSSINLINVPVGKVVRVSFSPIMQIAKGETVRVSLPKY